MAKSSGNTATATRPKSRSRSIRELARPDEWALNMELRVDGHLFSLDGREYVRQIIRDPAPEIICPKAAQTAYTITAITKTLHNITERGWNGLYLLPVKTGAIPFVQARIDPMIDGNASLKAQFTSVDNRTHKQTVTGHNLYIRGTNIARELQEVPVDFEIWDERDRMVEENLGFARHRMDGSNVKKLFILSTPSEPGHGVYSDDEWPISDQHRWEVPCPGCGRFQVLNFLDNELEYAQLQVGNDRFDCVLECAFCDRKFRDEERGGLNAHGRWVPYNLDGVIRGYHINQFNSPTQPLSEIMRDYFQGLRDAKKMKTFYTENMGLPYVAAGDKLTPEILDKCRVKGHKLGGVPQSPLYIGVDVGGTFLHLLAYTLDRHGWRHMYDMKVLREFKELDAYLERLVNFNCVIDMHPEKRSARDLSIKYPGRFWLGYEMDRPQIDEIAVFDKVERGNSARVIIDRTLAFDTTTNEFMHSQVILPPDARDLGERMPRKDYNGFYYQMIQQVRSIEEDTQGREISRWKKNKNADHWHHADMFAKIATLRAPRLSISADVQAAMRRESFIG